MSSVDAMSAAVETQNAAIFTYGVATAFISSARRPMLEEFIAEHRTERDRLTAAITAAGGTAPEAAAGYTLPITVNDPVSAARVVLDSEIDCTVAYRALLEQADGAPARTLGVDGLTSSALRAARWRVALGERPATVAFPGRR
ncbi:ferritin-like domain-containing protein [Gordonia sp. VNQ95]|jgi:hypothetical protein|uniref:ferritin-like domain-containing protein n=1 Tax=Gordonia sp. VNQ95 TaxID=3156619 RepID=UPI0032B32006